MPLIVPITNLIDVAATIYDIANGAGVSIATVSRVFSGSKRVSDSTRSNVLKAAARLDYRPHSSAQSLARRRSSVVSAVIPMLTNYFFVEILRGLQDRMAESEYDLLIFSALTLDEVDVQMDRALQRGQSAGTFVFSSPMNQTQADRLRASSQAIVLVDCVLDGLDTVTTNNICGAESAARHLIECGCSRIGMIMANPCSIPAQERRTGFENALREAGRDLDDGVVVTSEEYLSHGYTEQDGYEAMQKLMAMSDRPDGVFATSDIQAIGALRAAREMGISVPEEIRIVGFDDILISRHLGLTTIRQPMYEMGAIAAARIISRIENPTQDHEQTVLSPELIVRGTTLQTSLSVGIGA